MVSAVSAAAAAATAVDLHIFGVLCDIRLTTKLLSDAKVVCYIGHVFVGALAYADDIVLLAPSARAMRK